MIRSKNIVVFLLCITCMIALTSCSKADEQQSNVSDTKSGKVVLEMEMDENYDDSDPFENELLFCVSEDVDDVEAEVFYKMKGENGTVEIKNRNNGDILWTHTWEEAVNINVFPIYLSNLKKGEEYVVRFIGTKINHVVLKVTFDSDEVKEKERPSK